MKRSETMSLKEAFASFLDEEPDFHERLVEQQAQSLLPEIFGPLWAKIRHAELSAGVLILHVYSASVKQGVLLGKQSLIERINMAVGVEIIRDIQLR